MPSVDFASLTPAQQELVLDSPALQPPPGIQPNFYDPPNANNIVYPTLILGLFLSSIAIFIRIHGRWYCMKTVAIRDLMGIGAFLLFVAQLAIYLEEIPHPNAGGFFIHQWDLRVRDLRPFFLKALIILNLYSGVMLLLKTAILSEWLHIFSPPGSRNAFYWACKVTMILNVLAWSIGIVLSNVACIPHAAIYDKTIPGRCSIDQKTLDVSAATFNFVADLVILVVPQAPIWKLKMSPMKRLGLSLVFTIGIFACLSAGIRLGFTISYLDSADVTYTYSEVALWTVAEITCGLIVFAVTVTPRSFASFKRSKVFLLLKPRDNSMTKVPSAF
ncbi:hypothetical protein F5Y10DRAFT_245887 [Nemania abortiva]|nr:hypothetical protein F5Y10DRAFT_245887 [Nemania abortiva]